MFTISLFKSIIFEKVQRTYSQYFVKWVKPLNTVLPEFEINTPIRIAAFLAQVGHESANFKHTRENLNYSHVALLRVFLKYFKTASAKEYARKPEKIANRVYANRMGNGDEASGDGYKYRGRGLIQLTGKHNYEAYSLYAYGDNRIVNQPDLLIEPEDALRSACWFWKVNGCNEIADTEDFTKLTRRINGGTTGLEDRLHRYERIIKILRDM